MDIASIIALGMGAAWASGINLYATIATLGVLGATGNFALPPDLQILAHPMVIGAAALMYCVEFFADKTPGVDTAWDTLHTFLRIPAGAALAAGALGTVSPEAQVAALIIGGGLAATSHTLKAGTRVLINTSPEPFSNWAASVAGDVAVFGGVLLAVYEPTVFLGLLAVFVAVAAWAIPRLWRVIRALVQRVGRWLGLAKAPPAGADDLIELRLGQGPLPRLLPRK
jgi:hypothetical protein